MSQRFYILLGAILALSACQSEGGKKKSQANIPAADIVVRATSELNAPTSIIATTFVPNSVASWLGHIIMIDKNGNLHRSTSDSQVSLIDKGDYSSVIGLARIKQPGVFLAVTESGSLKAFIESDDEGNFKALPISIKDGTRLSEFCQNSTPSGDKIWAVNDKNITAGFKVSVTDNASIAIEPIEADIKSASCAPLIYDSDNTLSLDKASPHLSALIDGETKTVSITNGLSIAGITNPAHIGATTANMGSVFRDGVILASDEDSGRIVLIARDYFVDTLSE